MKLLDWAVRAYARPGVQGLCLTMQDDHGQCVGFLLWAAWAARGGRRIDAARLAEAAALAREWETAIVAPLRSVRRALKQPNPNSALVAPLGLRDRIKLEEFIAEGALLEALEAMTPARSDEPLGLVQALDSAARVWGDPPPPAMLEALGRAFSNV